MADGHAATGTEAVDEAPPGLRKEGLRLWVAQANVNAGERDAAVTEELQEIRRLKAESRRLREDNAMLESATAFCASMPE